MYPIAVAFSKACPRIVVEVKNVKDINDTQITSGEGVTGVSEIETRILTEEEKEKLIKGIKRNTQISCVCRNDLLTSLFDIIMVL